MIRPIEVEMNESVVRAIEALLERAKAGEIISFVSISQIKGGGWFEQSSGVQDMLTLLGMAEMAAHEIKERLLGR